jgi:hypothetical protein
LPLAFLESNANFRIGKNIKQENFEALRGVVTMGEGFEIFFKDFQK